MRVLVADDDRVTSHLICALARRNGWMAVTAFDSMQTLMLAMRAPQPDTIVLDLNMPGGTGLDVLRRLKTSVITMSIPVLVVSGNTDPETPAVVQRIGAERFLAKPVDMEALVATLRDLMTPVPLAPVAGLMGGVYPLLRAAPLRSIVPGLLPRTRIA